MYYLSYGGKFIFALFFQLFRLHIIKISHHLAPYRQLFRSVVDKLLFYHIALVVFDRLCDSYRIFILLHGLCDHPLSDLLDFLGFGLCRFDSAIPKKGSHLIAENSLSWARGHV